jgi:hypothetical protein
MAVGLSKNENALLNGVHIHAFDNFRWYGPIMNQFWQETFPGSRPTESESFRHLFEHVVGAWTSLIEIHAGDLLDQKWSEAIEVMSIDAMKTPELARHIVAEFMPALIPGAYVFHQDFCFETTWWIHIYHHLLRHRFELSDPLPGASGMMFRVVSPITADDAKRVLAHDLADTEIADAAFALSLAMAVDRSDRRAIADAHVRYYEETECCDHVGRAEALRTKHATL